MPTFQSPDLFFRDSFNLFVFFSYYYYIFYFTVSLALIHIKMILEVYLRTYNVGGVVSDWNVTDL